MSAITAIPGSPESPVLAFWGGIPAISLCSFVSFVVNGFWFFNFGNYPILAISAILFLQPSACVPQPAPHPP
jgi:hypothetical protein